MEKKKSGKRDRELLVPSTLRDPWGCNIWNNDWKDSM